MFVSYCCSLFVVQLSSNYLYPQEEQNLRRPEYVASNLEFIAGLPNDRVTKSATASGGDRTSEIPNTNLHPLISGLHVASLSGPQLQEVEHAASASSSAVTNTSAFNSTFVPGFNIAESSSMHSKNSHDLLPNETLVYGLRLSLQSACGLCHLPLRASGMVGEQVGGVTVRRCGHAYHAVCLAAAGVRACTCALHSGLKTRVTS